MFQVIIRKLVVVGTGAPAVVNDHTGPVVVPVLFFATICQKYLVPPTNDGGAYQKSVVFDTTVGGGFETPTRISYEVAPDDFQLRFGAVVTPTVPSGGFGVFGAAGPLDGGVPSVLNDQMAPAAVPVAFFAITCQ